MRKKRKTAFYDLYNLSSRYLKGLNYGVWPCAYVQCDILNHLGFYNVYDRPPRNKCKVYWRPTSHCYRWVDNDRVIGDILIHWRFYMPCHNLQYDTDKVYLTGLSVKIMIMHD